MRQGQQNRRGRGRNNNNNNNSNQNRKGQHHHNPLMRTYQSTGPDQKIHGTPAQIAEKYMSLARDALSSGDHVLAENYLQHAEHYNRIILTYREQQMQQNGGEMPSGMHRPRPFPGPSGEPYDGDGDEGGDGGDGNQDQMNSGGQQAGPRGNEPQPRMFDQPRQNEGYRDNGQQGQQHRDRDGNRDRDRDRNFRPRQGDQRFGQDRQDRGPDRGPDRGQDRGPDRNQDRGDRDRGDQRDRGGMRGDMRGDRPMREPRGEGFRGEGGERQDRMDRPRGDRPERFDRGDRPDRGPDRAPERGPDRGGDFVERPVAASVPDRGFVEPAPVSEPVAAPVAPRRRERFVEAASDQPEFLRRPVRRPRREAATEGAEPAAPTPRRETDEPAGS